MIIITKSSIVADRLAAGTAGQGRLRLCVMVVVSGGALGSIYLMTQGNHTASALGFLCVIIVALALRLHDVGLRSSGDGLAAGLAGERAVTAALAGLDDRYILVNGLQFANPRGELDHLLIGPHGLLGLETKAHDGHIVCTHGHWRRWRLLPDGRMQDLQISNPSAQLTRTLRLLRALLASWGDSSMVDGAIVFTHPQVELELDQPPLPVLRLDDLPAYVATLPDGALPADVLDLLVQRLQAYEPLADGG